MGWGDGRRARRRRLERLDGLRIARAVGADEERAAITAWLRDVCECPTGRVPHQLADAIDRLEHHGRAR